MFAGWVVRSEGLRFGLVSCSESRYVGGVLQLLFWVAAVVLWVEFVGDFGILQRNYCGRLEEQQCRKQATIFIFIRMTNFGYCSSARLRKSIID